MTRQLLVQSCSATKSEGENPVPALDRYEGYFYKIIKKAMREGEMNPNIDICILSAEHGLLDPDEEIANYDRRMDETRAEELRPEVVDALRSKIGCGEYDRVILNMGAEYRRAVEGFDDGLDVETEYVEGGGIGEKGHNLKRLLRMGQKPETEA